MYFMTKISPQTQVSIAYFCCSVSREGEKLIYTKAVTRVSFLVWKVVWGPHMSTAGPGHSAARGQGGKTPWSSGFIWNCKGILAMKMIVVHVIKVVVLVVKICDTCSRHDLKIWIVIQTAVCQSSGVPFRQIVLECFLCSHSYLCEHIEHGQTTQHIFVHCSSFQRFESTKRWEWSFTANTSYGECQQNYEDTLNIRVKVFMRVTQRFLERNRDIFKPIMKFHSPSL